MSMSQLCAVVFVSRWSILLLFIGAFVAAFCKSWSLAGGLLIAGFFVAALYGAFLLAVNK